MRATETIDVSRPPESTRTEKAAEALSAIGGSVTIALVVVAVLASGIVAAQGDRPARSSAYGEDLSSALEQAQLSFYSGRYEDAAALSESLCAAGTGNLEACELRTSSLHFQIRRAMGDSTDRDQAWSMCASCAGLLSAFVAETSRGRASARDRLQRDPHDEAALFLLGKIDLNYVWLQLGTRAHKTGWDEYWEARTSLDKVLERNPSHIRARVARAWIDYIVGSKMPRGTRWLLGGGNKKKGLRVVREAASSGGDFFERAEAGFALWDMHVRERDLANAIATAEQLARDFPDNRELARFLSTQRGSK